MFPRVNSVHYTGDYRLELGFTDGLKKEIAFAPLVAGRGGVFIPLADVDYFETVQLDPDAGTIFWPNAVDFCPDVLHEIAAGRSVPIRQSA